MPSYKFEPKTIDSSLNGFSSWKNLLSEALWINGETWDDVVSSTLTEEQLTGVFDTGFGSIKGCAFTLWTAKSVYFPLVYDGAESVGRVSRNPDGVPTEHQSG